MKSVSLAVIILQLFQKHNSRVTKYLGDGHSRAFAYASSKVEWSMLKLECANHYAKRFTAQALNTKKD